MSCSKEAWCEWPMLPRASAEEPLPIHAPELVYFLDTETTGLSRSTDRVVEVAVACVDRRTWSTVWERAQLLDPGRAMPDAASRVNGITSAMVRGKPVFVDVWPKVAAKVPAGSVVVAHNASFDRAMLEAECERTRYPAPDWRWEDSRALAKRVLPGRSHKLQDLRHLLQTPGGGAHRALGDVQTLVAIYRALTEREAEERARAVREAAPLLTRKITA